MMAGGVQGGKLGEKWTVHYGDGERGEQRGRKRDERLICGCSIEMSGATKEKFGGKAFTVPGPFW